jgi:uncharacterized coiled-coil protein SlyX
MSSLERALVERDKKIEALEAEKAAYADRLTELEDRLINMLQQRVALLEEKMGLEERLADIEKAAIAAQYRIPKDKINTTTCVGRILDGNADRRWKPFVYREEQCGGKIAENGLCDTCLTRKKKYETIPNYDRWNGIVTEEPLARVHMLGTEWAEKRKPVFID